MNFALHSKSPFVIVMLELGCYCGAECKRAANEELDSNQVAYPGQETVRAFVNLWVVMYDVLLGWGKRFCPTSRRRGMWDFQWWVIRNLSTGWAESPEILRVAVPVPIRRGSARRSRMCRIGRGG